ncbi:SMC-Scp complex subunit ScpB [Criblamydia sequanensis]|uniref:Segregation and condensation protein B n=1 Tax=Candidatus Criblamydia sequanensis CRIB-18 TaxID=1437425 RepID=A0A090D0I7_9BACT|nr:Segregation and condensation protein B [Criblamydia sequanensis CRIB-18]
MLFATSEPITLNKIREVTDSFYPLKPSVLLGLMDELQSDYMELRRGFRLEEIAGGYLLRSCEEFTPYIQLLYREKRGEKLSQASSEVLAIIAYRQPITRAEIESIRGVDSSYVVGSLLERGLIEPSGKLEAPGRPTLYSITQEFLSHFGLKDIKELPELKSLFPNP